VRGAIPRPNCRSRNNRGGVLAVVTGTAAVAVVDLVPELAPDLLTVSFSLVLFREPVDDGAFAARVSSALAISRLSWKLIAFPGAAAEQAEVPPAVLVSALAGGGLTCWKFDGPTFACPTFTCPTSAVDMAIKPCVMHLRGQEKTAERANREWPRKSRRMRWIARSGAAIRSRPTRLPRCRNFGEYSAIVEI